MATVKEGNYGLDSQQKETFYKGVKELVNQVNNATIEACKAKISSGTIIERGVVPDSHRRTADNFMIIKKIFGHPVVHSRLNQEERSFLARYDFNPLEFSTSRQIQEELILLKKWSNSRNEELEYSSDRLINIRAKELRNLIATNYVDITNDIYNGFKALEKYFENISKYHTER